MAETKTARQVLELLTSMQADTETETKEQFRIGDLAREFNISLRTLRFYEDRGLLHPKRAGSTRLYSNNDRKRLHVILTTKGVGFSLIDIENMLSLYDDDSQLASAADIILEKFSTQLEVLRKQKVDIEKAITMLQNVTRMSQKVG